MVFTKLSVQEKDAFFGLLDEYFQSRPELFGQNAQGTTRTVSPAAAASAVQRALSGGSAASSIGSGVIPSWKRSNNAVMTSNDEDDGHHQALTSLGRVAAASLAFSGGAGAHTSTSDSAASPAPSLPSRRIPSLSSHQNASGGVGVPSSTSTLAASAISSIPGTEVDKLVSRKTSVFSAFKKAPQGEGAGVAIPPAFAVPKNTFGPPPVRRTVDSTGGGGGASGSARVPTPAASESNAEADVMEGEWAEVLYDYSSEDPGDLTIEAGTRVFVTTKSSEDWWTGLVEGQGKEGLFPASYVKLL